MRADFAVVPIAQAYAETLADAKTQPFGALPLGLSVIVDVGVIAGDFRERPWTGFVHHNALLR
jgi:hypothetical protein